MERWEKEAREGERKEREIEKDAIVLSPSIDGCGRVFFRPRTVALGLFFVSPLLSSELGVFVSFFDSEGTLSMCSSLASEKSCETRKQRRLKPQLFIFFSFRKRPLRFNSNENEKKNSTLTFLRLIIPFLKNQKSTTGPTPTPSAPRMPPSTRPSSSWPAPPPPSSSPTSASVPSRPSR